MMAVNRSYFCAKICFDNFKYLLISVSIVMSSTILGLLLNSRTTIVLTIADVKTKTTV